MATVVIHQGTSITDLQNLQQTLYAIESAQPEGTKMELKLHLAYRFPGFANRVADLNYAFHHLPTGEPITPWPEYPDGNIALDDGNQPIIYIRWRKMAVQILVVIAVLVTFTIFLALIVGWIYSRETSAGVIDGTEQFFTDVVNSLKNIYDKYIKGNPVAYLTLGLGGLLLVFLSVDKYNQYSEEARYKHAQIKARERRKNLAYAKAAAAQQPRRKVKVKKERQKREPEETESENKPEETEVELIEPEDKDYGDWETDNEYEQEPGRYWVDDDGNVHPE